MSENEKKLTAKDLNKVYLRWYTGYEASKNYERMSAMGLCYSLVPAITKLYKDNKEERIAALKRHLVFFEVESQVGAFIPGLICSLEEDKANGKPITDEMINGIKVGLMGPLSGIGDTITQGLVMVLLLSISINLARDGILFAPFLYAILFGAYILGMGRFTFLQGYHVGRNVLSKVTDSTIIQKITECMSVMGMTIAGSMLVSNVNISTPLVLTFADSTIVLNDLLSSIAPNILGAIAVFVVFRLLRKGVAVNKIIIGIFIVGFVGSLVGIL